jgi:hypothetical protein
LSWIGARRKRELNFEGKSAEVIENTYRKNVRFQPCAEVVEN